MICSETQLRDFTKKASSFESDTELRKRPFLIELRFPSGSKRVFA